MPPSSHAPDPPSGSGSDPEVGVIAESNNNLGVKPSLRSVSSFGTRLFAFVKMITHGVVNSKLFKYVLLFTLTINTSMTVLILRLSKFSLGSDGKHYVSATVILVSEVMKFLICLAALVCSEGLYPSFRYFSNEIFGKWRETIKLAIPAFLYMAQNNLLFVAVKYIDPATYQITYQMKILTTALCMVFMLNRRLRSKQWLSLLILTMGVILVQLDKMKETDDQATKEADTDGTILGLTFIGIACFSSAIAGVYYEKLVKTGAQQSVIVRNLQLTALSIPLTLLPIYGHEQTRAVVLANGFFGGYNWITWTVVICQAFGGLLVAVVVKYTDNILKGFATSISIVICTVFSFFAEAETVTIGFKFALGTSLVIASSFMYNAAGGVANTNPVAEKSEKKIGYKSLNGAGNRSNVV